MLDKSDVALTEYRILVYPHTDIICLVTTELQSFAAARRIHPAHLVSNQEIFNFKHYKLS
jgi:hypothetical protein